MEPLRIAIIGGGIAGLSVAAGLLEAKKKGANISVDVYEAASKFAEIGAGVSVGPNAERAYRLMGAGQVLQAAAGLGDPVPSHWFDFYIGQKDHERSGEYVCSIKGTDESKRNMNVHRADLLDQLIALVPSEVSHFDRRCSAYTPLDDGRVELTFSAKTGQEERTTVDVAIAADGIKSAVRRSMYERLGLDLESQAARYAEWIAWRGLVPRATFEEAMGKGAEVKMMHMGEGRHILHFGVRSGELVNIVAFVRDTKREKLGDHTGPWAEPRSHDEMLEDFAGFNDDCRALLRSISNPSIWGIFWLPPIETIRDGATVLIGDAAHATTPHHGAGAGQAVEDALFLSQLLSHDAVADANNRQAQVHHALDVYYKARHARAVRVQETSFQAGLLYDFQGPEGGDVDKLKQSLEHRLEWIWDYDTEAKLNEALAALSQ